MKLYEKRENELLYSEYKKYFPPREKYFLFSKSFGVMDLESELSMVSLSCKLFCQTISKIATHCKISGSDIDRGVFLKFLSKSIFQIPVSV